MSDLLNNKAEEESPMTKDQCLQWVRQIGFRFLPTDEQLIVLYLNKRRSNFSLPCNIIDEVNIYDFIPDDLEVKYKILGQKELYFFTPRDCWTPNGSRPKRTASNGYWKASGGDKPISSEGRVVGHKMVLNYYSGERPSGKKSNWIMHEYKVVAELTPPRCAKDSKLDNWALCKIYKKGHSDEVFTNQPEPSKMYAANHTGGSRREINRFNSDALDQLLQCDLSNNALVSNQEVFTDQFSSMSNTRIESEKDFRSVEPVSSKPQMHVLENNHYISNNSLVPNQVFTPDLKLEPENHFGSVEPIPSNPTAHLIESNHNPSSNPLQEPISSEPQMQLMENNHDISNNSLVPNQVFTDQFSSLTNIIWEPEDSFGLVEPISSNTTVHLTESNHNLSGSPVESNQVFTDLFSYLNNVELQSETHLGLVHTVSSKPPMDSMETENGQLLWTTEDDLMSHNEESEVIYPILWQFNRNENEAEEIMNDIFPW